MHGVPTGARARVDRTIAAIPVFRITHIVCDSFYSYLLYGPTVFLSALFILHDLFYNFQNINSIHTLLGEITSNRAKSILRATCFEKNSERYSLSSWYAI